jgi:hypothetical protein
MRDELEPFDPARTNYTATELEAYADELLMADARGIDPETGKERGIKGDSPILFETHLKARARREVQTGSGMVEDHLTVNTMGQPGMYNRVEPRGGRKVNSEDARRKHGASFFSG